MPTLQGLPDDRLLADLHLLVRNGRVLEAKLLAHLGEVDHRRLYLREACSSMFAYCVEVLHFPEASAFKRIAAARAARRFPTLLGCVERGELHVTALRLLAPHLKQDNAEELIALAKHRTADRIKRALADRQPKPDVATSVRRVAAAVDRGIAGGTPLMLGKAIPTAGRRANVNTRPVQRAPNQTEELGQDRYCIRFTASPGVHSQLREIQALLRHKFPDGDLAKILGHAVAVLHKQVRKQKFADCDARPGAEIRDSYGSSVRHAPSRRIPAAVRRAVAHRDSERCTYVSPSGRRCNASEFLEFHHRIPWARSRRHDAENITMRCRSHNQFEAEKDFGCRHMERFRRRESVNPTGLESS